MQEDVTEAADLLTAWADRIPELNKTIKVLNRLIAEADLIKENTEELRWQGESLVIPAALMKRGEVSEIHIIKGDVNEVLKAQTITAHIIMNPQIEPDKWKDYYFREDEIEEMFSEESYDPDYSDDGS
jgi:hypothetical protein